MLTQYTSATITATDAIVDPNNPDYFIYSPDVFNGTTYLGGWRTLADVGPDQLYSSAGAATDAAVPLVWNGFVPYGSFHVNDPSVVQESNGTLAMFATALPNVDATAALMMNYNQTALITSTNGGASWTWQGIVIGENNGYNNTGAWSPTALTVGNNIDVWYNTGATDVVTGKSLPPQVLLTQMNSTGTQVQSTTACIDTATNSALSADNVDVMQAADGTYWMVANDFSNNTLVAYESKDGVNWTPWSTNGPSLLNASSTGNSDGFSLLTPTILSVGNGQLNLMVSEQIGGATIEHTINFNLTDSAPVNNFTVADVVNGVQGTMLSVAGDTYSGPVTYLSNEFIYLGPENLNIVATTPNAFIRGGEGNDALVVHSGNNVLDGGTGSNFLTGGSGQDVFFSEAGNGQNTWSTINNFHSGDQLTIWDIAPNVTGLNWLANKGASGYTGATESVMDASSNSASVTLAGWSTAQAASLQVSFGINNGQTYMHLTAP